jgi:anti-sigma B factor antagonist
MDANCSIRQSQICNMVSIEIAGPFNAPHSDISTIIQKAISEGEINIVIDLRKTTYFTSNGLACLIVALKHIRTANGTMYILGPTADMVNVFNLTRLMNVFIVAQNEEELMKIAKRQ